MPRLITDIISEPLNISDWLTKGVTYLLSKNKKQKKKKHTTNAKKPPEELLSNHMPSHNT